MGPKTEPFVTPTFSQVETYSPKLSNFFHQVGYDSNHFLHFHSYTITMLKYERYSYYRNSIIFPIFHYIVYKHFTVALMTLT